MFLARHFKREFTRGFLNKLALIVMLPGLVLLLPGLLLFVPTFRRLARQFDYAEYGGALLLGVNGVTIIGHGRSNAKAVKNAVRVASLAVDGRMLDSIKQGVADMQKMEA